MAGAVQTDPDRYFQWLDKVTSQADRFRQQLDDLDTRPTLGPMEMETRSRLTQSLADTNAMLEQENVGLDAPLYAKWYKQKFAPQPTPTSEPASQGNEELPSPIRRLFGPALRGVVKGQEFLANIPLEGAEMLGFKGARGIREKLHGASERLQTSLDPTPPESMIGKGAELVGELTAPMGAVSKLYKGGSALARMLKGSGAGAGAATGIAATEAASEGAPKIAGLLEPNKTIYQHEPPKALLDYSHEAEAAQETLNKANRYHDLRDKQREFPPNTGERDASRRYDSFMGEAEGLEGTEKLSPPYPGSSEGAANALSPFEKTVKDKSHPDWMKWNALQEAGWTPSQIERVMKKKSPKKGNASPLAPEGEAEKTAGAFVANATGTAMRILEQAKEAGAGVFSNNPIILRSGKEDFVAAKDRLLSPLQTPDFALRKTETGNRLVDVAYEAERKTDALNNQFHYSFDPAMGLKPTGLQIYQDAPKEIAASVDTLMHKAEQLGSFDKAVGEFKAAPEIAAIAKGIREQDDKLFVAMHAAHRALEKEGLSPNFIPPSYLPEHVPHRWLGRWEIYVNGQKVMKEGEKTSSYARPGELLKAVEALRVKNPDANIFIKDWASDRGGVGYKAVGAKFKSLMPREGTEGFSLTGKDMKTVWDSYFHEGSRFLAMAEAKLAASQLIKNGKDLRPQDVTYAQELIDRMAGRPTFGEALIERAVRDTGMDKYIDPNYAAKGMFSDVRRITTWTKLGFANVSYAMFNTFGIAQNVYPMLSRYTKDPLKWTLEGVKGLGDTRLREYLTHNGVIDIQTMEKLPAFGELEKADKVIMYFGRKTEEMSRTVAAVARYKLAKQEGLGEQDALAAAHRFSAETLGLYTSTGKPAAFQGIIGGLGGQFKTYPVIMLQNMVRSLEGGDPKMALRYIVANVGLAGVFGLMPGADALDGLITETFGVSPKAEVRKVLVEKFGAIGEAPLTGAMSALPDLLGQPELAMDWSGRLGVENIIPKGMMDFLGPSLSTLAKATQATAEGDYWGIATAIGVQPISNLARLRSGEGTSGRRDRKMTDLSPKEQFVKGAGFPPLREAREMEELRSRGAEAKYVAKQRQRQVDRIIDDPEDLAALEAAQGLGVTGRMIQQERNRKGQTALERQERMLPKVLRQQ